MTDATHITLTAMTYNVGNGLATPARLVALLRASAADIIGLQELDAAQAAAFARELSNTYPHQVLYPTGYSGKGLLSRLPILEHAQLLLYPDRPDLRATLDVGEATLTVVVGHPPPQRRQQARLAHDPAALGQIRVLGQTAVARRPALLLGDFNMTERHPAYRRLIALGLTDAFRAAGRGRGYSVPTRLGQSERRPHRFGWLALVPFLRFDYIFHTPELRAEAAWLGQDAGSDHLPVLARLRLGP